MKMKIYSGVVTCQDLPVGTGRQVMEKRYQEQLQRRRKFRKFWARLNPLHWFRRFDAN